MDDIIILDNFLPLYIQDQIEDLCYEVPWNLNKSANFDNSEGGNSLKGMDSYYDHEQLIYLFWDTRKRDTLTNLPLIDYNHYTNVGHYFSLPLQIASLKNKFAFNLRENFNRGKVNLTYSDNNSIPLPRPPHRDMDGSVDYLRNTWSIIYYVNETDGDTIIYNEKEYLNDFSKYTIKQSISPKKGRIAILRGDLFHSSSVPSNKYSKRIVINYNLIF